MCLSEGKYTSYLNKFLYLMPSFEGKCPIMFIIMFNIRGMSQTFGNAQHYTLKWKGVDLYM